jgi:hypothetical protein
MMPRARATLAAAFLMGLALAPGGAPPARAADAAQRFDTLAREFVEGWLERHPERATALGDHRHDALLRVPGEAARAADLGWLAAQRAAFLEVPREALPPARRAERDLVLAAIEAERFENEARRPFERDPAHWAPLLDEAVRGSLESGSGSACTRVLAATSRLRLAPEVVRAARVALRRPDAATRDAAIARLHRTLRFLRAEIGPLAAGCREPLAQADLAEADSGAVRAIEAFIDDLARGLVPVTAAGPGMGRDTLALWLRAVEREGAPPESLLARARREAEGILARTGGGDAHDAPAATDPTTADAAVGAARRALEESRRLMQTARLAKTTDDGLTVRAGAAPDGDRVRLLGSGPLERGKAGAVLEVPPPPVDAHELAFEVLHHGVPGRRLRDLALAREAGPLWRTLGSPAGREGWPAYAEGMMVEAGWRAADPNTARALDRRRLVELARAVAALRLHGGREPLEEIARELEGWGLAPAAAARLAADGLDPAAMAATLGRWRLEDLRAEAASRLGRRFTPRALHDAVLRRGASPIPVARTGVLHDLGLPPDPTSP